jgi:hypothetical protein
MLMTGIRSALCCSSCRCEAGSSFRACVETAAEVQRPPLVKKQWVHCANNVPVHGRHS